MRWLYLSKAWSVSCFRDKIVSKEFMRKYIHIAKAVTPVLTEEAANHIAEEYSRLRSQEQMGADIARVSRNAHTHTHTPFYMTAVCKLVPITGQTNDLLLLEKLCRCRAVTS